MDASSLYTSHIIISCSALHVLPSGQCLTTDQYPYKNISSLSAAQGHEQHPLMMITFLVSLFTLVSLPMISSRSRLIHYPRPTSVGRKQRVAHSASVGGTRADRAVCWPPHHHDLPPSRSAFRRMKSNPCQARHVGHRADLARVTKISPAHRTVASRGPSISDLWCGPAGRTAAQ